MLRVIAGLFLLALTLAAANIKLYLTDGTYHLVREYEVMSDRVRFYSIERSEWEEIPLELVDLPRTEREAKEREEAERKKLEFWEAEERAERARQREIASVPMEAGVYLVDNGRMRPVPQAELNVKTNKKRQILKILTPIPVVAGKRTVFIDGEHAEMVIPTATPQFYIRLFQEERFGIIRLQPKDGKRLVEQWAVMPVTDQIIEEHSSIEIFRRQVGDNLYKIWPKKPLEAGEYAVVEFSLGEANIQAWDFSYQPAAPVGNR